MFFSNLLCPVLAIENLDFQFITSDVMERSVLLKARL